MQFKTLETIGIDHAHILMGSTVPQNWKEDTRADRETTGFVSAPHWLSKAAQNVGLEYSFYSKTEIPSLFLFVDPFKGSYFVYQETTSIVVFLLPLLQSSSYFKKC